MWSMTRSKVVPAVWLLFWVCAAGQAQPATTQHTLVVGTEEAPPFAMKGPDGKWTGLSIDLWQHLAAELKFNYEFKEMDLEHLLSGVTNGSLDAVVAAVSVTSDREQVMDFTHPFYHAGLGIAVPDRTRAPWLAVLRRLVSWQFVTAVGLLVLVLLSAAFVVWLFERRKNAEHFGGKPWEGISAAFWWSAVTMTTVGYGDKAPRTLGGRIVALIWMFTAIIIISSFTAAITSALTVHKLGSRIRGPRDLSHARVGGIADSTGEQYLKRQHVIFQDYANASDALKALDDGRVDAVVYDAPILQYLTKENYPGAITVLPRRFVHQDYAIAVPQGSPLREQLDRVLESEIRSPHWQELAYRYLGEED
jgi:polar amino acid transport system substrate-binding protein